MDRQYFYQNHVREHEREIQHKLAQWSLLKDARREPLTGRSGRQLVWRLAPAVVILAGLLVLAFLI